MNQKIVNLLQKANLNEKHNLKNWKPYIKMVISLKFDYNEIEKYKFQKDKSAISIKK